PRGALTSNLKRTLPPMDERPGASTTAATPASVRVKFTTALPQMRSAKLDAKRGVRRVAWITTSSPSHVSYVTRPLTPLTRSDCPGSMTNDSTNVSDTVTPGMANPTRASAPATSTLKPTNKTKTRTLLSLPVVAGAAALVVARAAVLAAVFPLGHQVADEQGAPVRGRHQTADEPRTRAEGQQAESDGNTPYTPGLRGRLDTDHPRRLGIP